MNILITGSTGFVGHRLFESISNRSEYQVYVAVRDTCSIRGHSSFLISSLDSYTDWTAALSGISVVIHSAARVHIMKDEVSDPLSEYRRVNVDGTLNLARQAASSGVKRFIFISSIKVNGDQTPLGQPFTADDTPAPEDAYGISKWEAEQGLLQLAAETSMEVVIIRPPLVYGRGVKGNFSSMIKLVSKGLPLPFGSIHNQRSLVALDNLVDLIIVCIDHPAAANQIFLAGDGHDLSTAELLQGVARAMSVPSMLFPVPICILQSVFMVLGKKRLAQRIIGSLQVDISKTRDLLGWTPPVTVDEGLNRCFEPDF